MLTIICVNNITILSRDNVKINQDKNGMNNKKSGRK